jgi:hypothetical protein
MPNKIDLRGSTSLLKQIIRFNKTLNQGAEFLRGRILRNWNQAKSPDGSPFRGLSTKAFFFNVGTKSTPKYMTFEGGYKEFKAATGRKPIRDLNLTGRMTQGFYVDDRQAFKKVLKFKAPEIPKARGNAARTPNMLKISPKLEKLVIRTIEKLFCSKVK